MAKFNVYKPTPIVIPESLGIYRKPPLRTQHEIKAYNVKEENINLSKTYDTHILFYDVAYNHNNSSIIAIGPEMFNLKQDLSPLELYINNKLIKYQIEDVCYLSILKTEAIESAQKITLTIKIPHHQWEIVIQPNTYCCTKHDLTMSTLQKNNPASWIIDWIQYHHQVHNVTRVILYDNDSDIVDRIINNLKHIPYPIEIIFVPWPYLHGNHVDHVEKDGSHGKRYIRAHSQFGALNHCNQIFGNHGWLLNLDIDEYYAGKSCLATFLSKKKDNKYLFDRLIMLDMYHHQVAKRPSYRDFIYKEVIKRKVKPKGKYVGKFGQAIFAVHTYTDNTKINDISHNTSPSEVKTVKYSAKIKKHLLRLPFISTLIKKEEKLYYYQYDGLSTRWRFDHIKRLNRRLSKKDYVIDKTILKLAKKHGLV